jgi:hypothetical protein
LDWTDFDADNQATIILSLITGQDSLCTSSLCHWKGSGR